MANESTDRRRHISGVTINGVSLGDIQLVHVRGLTQFADERHLADQSPAAERFSGGQSAAGVGQRQRPARGQLFNGRSIDLADISLVDFNGANFLKRIDGGAFEATDGSALPSQGVGQIVASSLEDQHRRCRRFTDSVVTQQAYSPPRGSSPRSGGSGPLNADPPQRRRARRAARGRPWRRLRP
jgi:flagellar hook protein FlgE